MKKLLNVRTAAVCLAAAAVLAWVWVTYAAVTDALEARKRPRFDLVSRLLPGDWPHDIIARHVLFRPGARIYADAILPWILAENSGLSDTPWNRRMLEGFLEGSEIDLAAAMAADPFAFGGEVPFYPLTPSDALVQRIAAAAREGPPQLLSILARNASGRTLLQGWIDAGLAAGPSPSAFVELLPYALALGDVAVADLFARVNPPAEQVAEALDVLELELLSAAHWATLRSAVETWVAAARVDPNDLAHVFAAMLERDDVGSATARFLIDYVGRSTGGLRLLGCAANDVFAGCSVMSAVDAALRERLLQALFERVQSDPEAAADLFHTIAHTVPESASRIVAGACRQGDSEVRKSVLVLAVRHDLTVDCLDGAFAGPAPRNTLFANFDQYVLGSKAAQLYAEISGHEFFGIGKRWPPHYGREPMDEDADRWETFISRYPWFPALDDAYYRLAYAHFVGGRLDAAMEVVARYRAAVLRDDDSTPYLDLLELVARSERGEPVSAGQILAARQGLRDRAWSWTEESIELDRAAEWVDWLIRNQAEISTGAAAADLHAARRQIDLARAACAESAGEECRVPDAARRLRLQQISVPVRLAASYEAVVGDDPSGQ